MDASHRQADSLHILLQSENITNFIKLLFDTVSSECCYTADDCWMTSSGLVWGKNAQLIATCSNQLTPSWKTAAPTCASSTQTPCASRWATSTWSSLRTSFTSRDKEKITHRRHSKNLCVLKFTYYNSLRQFWEYLKLLPPPPLQRSFSWG